MIVLSLVLVIVAAVTLVLGVFQQDGLELIYVSIGTCLAAMVLLGIGVLMRRREEAGSAPSTSPTYGASSQAPASTAPQPGGGSQDVQVREAADTGELRPAKKAVVKKVSAPSTAAEAGSSAQDTSPFHPPSGEPADAGEATPAAAAPSAAAPGVSGRDQGEAEPASATAASPPPVKKVAVKKATSAAPATKKAAAKKTAKKAAAKKTAKKAAAKKTTKKAAAKKTTKKAAAKKTAKKAAAKKTVKKAAAKKTVKKAAAKKSAKKAAAKKTAPRAGTLPEIKGLGPTKAKALLEAFGSVEGIRKADASEIAAVKGVSNEMARTLKRELGD